MDVACQPSQAARSLVWQVWIETGRNNITSLCFSSLESAKAYFSRRWCARILVDPFDGEVCSSCGMNCLALRRVRALRRVDEEVCLALRRVRAAYEASGSRLGQTYKVTVFKLDGEALEIELPRSARVADVIDQVCRTWNLEHFGSTLILGERILQEDERLAVLDIDSEGHLTFTFHVEKQIARYEEVLRLIRHQQTLPALAGNVVLTELLSERDALRKKLTSEGWSVPWGRRVKSPSGV